MSVNSPPANSRSATRPATRQAASPQSPVRQGGTPQPVKGAKRADAASEQRDRRIVMILVGIFAVGALVLISMNVAATARTTRAKEAIGQTFVRMHSRQAEYRSNYGRFATWPELRASGAALGPRQSVIDSNADASHWFLSIRDTETGVICDRTGELLDAGAGERRPVCREQKAD